MTVKENIIVFNIFERIIRSLFIGYINITFIVLFLYSLIMFLEIMTAVNIKKTALTTVPISENKPL